MDEEFQPVRFQWWSNERDVLVFASPASRVRCKDGFEWGLKDVMQIPARWIRSTITRGEKK